MKKLNVSILLICLFFISGCKEINDSISSNLESIENSSSNVITNEDSSSITSEDNSSSISSDSSNEGVSTETEDENIYYSFKNKYSIYINPSVQYSNTYINNLGNEGTHMNEISNILVSLLTSYTNLYVYANNFLPGKSLSNSVKESNNLDVDYHLAIHSNAGGGKGSEIFYSKTSYNFSKSILDSLNDILPYKTRGLKDGSKSLYEIKSTTASASLLEILFHDEISQAKFIINNKYEIAYAIYEGIVSYFLKK